MSDSFEKLQEALASLKPQPVSAQLRRRLSRRIGWRRILLRWSAAATLATAAGLLGWVLWLHRASDGEERVPRARRVVAERHTGRDDPERLFAEPPTLWEYRAAALRSAEELDAVMRLKHRRVGAGVHDEPLTVLAYRDVSPLP